MGSHVLYYNRQVNKLFESLTRLLIVWINLFERNTLALSNVPDKTSAIEIESILVFAAQLEKRLSSPHPTTRGSWIVPEEVGEVNWSPSMSFAGNYLVLSGEADSFIAINVETRSISKINAAPFPSAHWVEASEATINGQPGIAIAAANILWVHLSCDGHCHLFYPKLWKYIGLEL